MVSACTKRPSVEHYYRAMNQIEGRMELSGSVDADDPPFTGGQLLALVDALRAGTLNDAQRETVQALREGILAPGGGGCRVGLTTSDGHGML